MSKEKSINIQLQQILYEKYQNFNDISGKAFQNVQKLLNRKDSHKRKQENLINGRLKFLQIFYISPIGRFALCYNIIYLGFFYMIQIHISLTMAFGQNFLSDDISNQGYNFYYWFMISFFMIDICLSFLKGYYDQKKALIIDNPKLLITKYIKGQFEIDFVCVIFLIIPQVDSQSYHQFLQFLPLTLLWIKKFKNQHQIIAIITFNKIFRTFFILFILFCDILLVGHFGACIFIKIDQSLYQSQYYGPHLSFYWIHSFQRKIQQSFHYKWYIKYIYAQSFSTGTLAKMPQGPIPRNPIQVFYSIILVTFFMILISYVAQVLIQLTQLEQNKRIIYQSNLQVLDKFMILKKVKHLMRIQIVNFFEVIWEIEQNASLQQQLKLINLLPNSLRQQIQKQTSFTKKLNFILNFKSANLIQNLLSKKVKKNFYISNSLIFHREKNFQIDQNKFKNYFSIGYVSKGILQYYISNYDKIQGTERQISIKLKSNSKKIKLKNIVEDNTQDINQENYNRKIIKQQSTQDIDRIVCFSNIDKFVGLYQFICHQNYWCNCKSLQLCQIDKIQQRDFIQVLQITGNKEQFYQLRYQVMIQNRLQLINKVCDICLDRNHNELNCPQLNYRLKLMKDMVRCFNNVGRNQERVPKFQRLNYQKQKNQCNAEIRRKSYQSFRIDKSNNKSILKINQLYKKEKQKKQEFYNIQSFQISIQNCSQVQKLSKITKVYNKKIPLILIQNKEKMIKKIKIRQKSFFNQIFSKNKIDFPGLIVNLTKITQFQKVYTWQEYFPSFNLNVLLNQNQN